MKMLVEYFSQANNCDLMKRASTREQSVSRSQIWKSFITFGSVRRGGSLDWGVLTSRLALGLCFVGRSQNAFPKHQCLTIIGQEQGESRRFAPLLRIRSTIGIYAGEGGVHDSIANLCPYHRDWSIAKEEQRSACWFCLRTKGTKLDFV